jgi:hypothetical protein
MPPRQHTAIRLSEESLKQVELIVASEPEATRSMILRRLLALGLAAWQQGHRSPETIKKAAK